MGLTFSTNSKLYQMKKSTKRYILSVLLLGFFCSLFLQPYSVGSILVGISFWAGMLLPMLNAE
jgi:hypothetical protein